jgi:hypothetical protein
MRTLPLAIALVLLTAALGCRNNTNQFLLQQESRMFEDEVYALEAELDATCQEKNALQRENEDLRRQLAGGGGSDSYRAPASVTAPAQPSSHAPLTEAPRLEAPTIELPEPSSTPPDTLLPADQQPAIPGAGSGSGSSLRRLPVELSINRRMTGGMDRDRVGGDEGIMVFVEPRDDEGRLTRAPGAVSVVVMDPSKTGSDARIARWDFQANEFAKHFKKSAFGEGLVYELAWPNGPPASRDLMLFVRYVTPEGAKLTSDSPLNIRLAGDYPREAVDTIAETNPQPEPAAAAASAETELAAEKASDASKNVTVAGQTPPRSRALIGPRAAKANRPEWKPYR